jgi:Recombination endonuclease VII
MERETLRTKWTCPKCKKEITDPKEIRWDGKYVKHCMECNREYERKYRKSPETKLITRNSNLKQKFGIDIEQFEEMKRAQGNACAICKQEPQNERELVVDHNHLTGEIRGLLCYSCNSAIGHLKENPDLFMEAYEYMERTTWNKNIPTLRVIK